MKVKIRKWNRFKLIDLEKAIDSMFKPVQHMSPIERRSKKVKKKLLT
jgi:hypothetical protein